MKPLLSSPLGFSWPSSFNRAVHLSKRGGSRATIIYVRCSHTFLPCSTYISGKSGGARLWDASLLLARHTTAFFPRGVQPVLCVD